jgi:hypothetical protein
MTEFIEARIAESQAKVARVSKVLWNIVVQDLECPLDP